MHVISHNDSGISFVKINSSDSISAEKKKTGSGGERG
jgi:hypothetical protein